MRLKFHGVCLYFQWRLRAQEIGYRQLQECVDAGDEAFKELSCWQFTAPDASSEEEWALVDVVLDSIEQLLSDFSEVSGSLKGKTADLQVEAYQDQPSTGIIFDVGAEGTCGDKEVTESGVFYLECQVPQYITFRAAPVSPIYGPCVATVRKAGKFEKRASGRLRLSVRFYRPKCPQVIDN